MQIIINNIYQDILELSNIDLQKKLWLNEHNDTGLISSYTEVMCRLFDDNNFDEFIEKTAPELGFSVAIISELYNLKNLLNNYEQKSSDNAILEDFEWKNIVTQAQIVLERWHDEVN